MTPSQTNSGLSQLPAVRKLGEDGAEPRAAGAFGDIDLTGQVVLGRYSIDEMIGGGAMGRVYKGRQLSIGRAVALKMVHPDSTWDREVARQRFHREARFLAGMQHPNVVNLVDYGITDDGHLVMVLEFLPGETLKAVIDRIGPLPHVRALNLSRQLVRALRRIHRLDGIHRDVKPSNMMLQDTEDGEELLKLLDFGLIKVCEDANRPSDITGSTPALGTPLFISPEQALGESVDARSDIYAAGVVMFNMLAGRPPFTGSNTPEVLTGHIRRPVPELRSLAPNTDCHPMLEQVIRRCLAKDADDRYPDTEELFRALTQVPGVPGAAEVHSLSSYDLSGAPQVSPVSTADVFPRGPSTGPLRPQSGAYPSMPQSSGVYPRMPPPVSSPANPVQDPAAGSNPAPRSGSQAPISGSQGPLSGSQPPISGSQGPLSGSQTPGPRSSSSISTPPPSQPADRPSSALTDPNPDPIAWSAPDDPAPPRPPSPAEVVHPPPRHAVGWTSPDEPPIGPPAPTVSPPTASGGAAGERRVQPRGATQMPTLPGPRLPSSAPPGEPVYDAPPPSETEPSPDEAAPTGPRSASGSESPFSSESPRLVDPAPPPNRTKLWLGLLMVILAAGVATSATLLLNPP